MPAPQLVSAHFDRTKITIVGRGFHMHEHVTGFYNAGDRNKIWGQNGGNLGRLLAAA